MRLLKISNIKNIYEARTLAEQGVDFIGLHLVTRDHLERIPVFQQINRMLANEFPQTKSILVTKERSIERIIELIRSTGCQGIELHYPPVPGLFAMLRSYFGKSLIIMGVTSPVISPRPNEFLLSNYVIVNKNYVGGTGERIPYPTIQHMAELYKDQNVMLAGGIDLDAIRKLRVVSHISGYDIQTAVISDNLDTFENIDRKKAIEIVQAVKGKNSSVKSLKPPKMHVANLNQDLEPMFNKFHFFKFEIDPTNYNKDLKNIKEFAKLNSHLVIEVNIESDLLEETKKALKGSADKIKQLTVVSN
ncbi:MAG: hypothetical protein PVI21_00750 [Candidatus Woesebacteria bacterium]|jgi:phosphoribosylanthranilate isomerase